MNQIITGCYMGTRGRRLAELTTSGLFIVSKDLEKEVNLLGRGCWQAPSPIHASTIDTLEQAISTEVWYGRLVKLEKDKELRPIFNGRSQEIRDRLYSAVEKIRQNPYRKQVSFEELNHAQLLLAVEEDVLERYLKIGTPKEAFTVLDFLGLEHPKYGYDLDDAHVPISWVLEEMIPAEKEGKNPIQNQDQYSWCSMEGIEILGKSRAADLEESQDLIVLSMELARKIRGISK